MISYNKFLWVMLHIFSVRQTTYKQIKKRLFLSVFHFAPTASDCKVCLKNSRKSAVSALSGAPLREI